MSGRDLRDTDKFTVTITPQDGALPGYYIFEKR